MTCKPPVRDMVQSLEMPADRLIEDDDDVFAFDPDGIFWRVCRERCSLLDGGAAAVLQVAHPKIAAGVRDHSDFRSGPVGRLSRTLDGVNTIAFGTRAEARAMAGRIGRRHSGVKGTLDGQPYAADDPELLLWVIATLVMAAVNGYERGVRRLSPKEREAFYAEMRQFGTYFGLPADVGPRTWCAFERYYNESLNQPWMGATVVSREMAWAVAAPAHPWWLRLASRPLRFTFSEIIPEPVCGRLGFRRTGWTSLCIRLTTFIMPKMLPLLPPRFRYAPQYVRALQRLKSENDWRHRG